MTKVAPYILAIATLIGSLLVQSEATNNDRSVHRLIGEHLNQHRPPLDDDTELLIASETGGNKKENETTEEKKTLAQQVAEGKYGLIQKELFSKPVKRPGVLSYDSNEEVPKDNISNLGGLSKNDIWLAENHLLVIKGGVYPGHEEGHDNDPGIWPPIDDYVAPLRQVKIPNNPKVPPPFPVQLQEGGPVQIIGFNSTRTLNATLKEALYPVPPGYLPPPEGTAQEGQNPAYPPSGETPFPIPPFPGFPGEFPPGGGSLNGSYPPFLPVPPPNPSDYEEDDPSIYYPPPYSFYYPKDNSSAVPAGPLVPGIVLPPPPNFFSSLDDRKPVKKPTTITIPKQIHGTTTPVPPTAHISTKYPVVTIYPVKIRINTSTSKPYTPVIRHPTHRKKPQSVTILHPVPTVVPTKPTTKTYINPYENEVSGKPFKIYGPPPTTTTSTTVSTTQVPLKLYYTTAKSVEKPRFIQRVRTTTQKPSTQVYFYEESTSTTKAPPYVVRAKPVQVEIQKVEAQSPEELERIRQHNKQKEVVYKLPNDGGTKPIPEFVPVGYYVYKPEVEQNKPLRYLPPNNKQQEQSYNNKPAVGTGGTYNHQAVPVYNKPIVYSKPPAAEYKKLEPEYKTITYNNKPEIEYKTIGYNKPREYKQEEYKPIVYNKPDAEYKTITYKQPEEYKTITYNKPDEYKPINYNKPEEYKTITYNKPEEYKTITYNKPEEYRAINYNVKQQQQQQQQVIPEGYRNVNIQPAHEYKTIVEDIYNPSVGTKQQALYQSQNIPGTNQYNNQQYHQESFVPQQQYNNNNKEQQYIKQQPQYFYVTSRPYIADKPRFRLVTTLKPQPNFGVHIAKLQEQLKTRYTTERPTNLLRSSAKPVYQFSFETADYKGRHSGTTNNGNGDDDKFRPLPHYSVQIQPAIEVIPTAGPVYQSTPVPNNQYQSTLRPVYQQNPQVVYSNNYNRPTYKSPIFFREKSTTPKPQQPVYYTTQKPFDNVEYTATPRPITQYSFQATPNPIYQQGYYTKQDETYFDDNTKKYFTVFGKKIPGVTTPGTYSQESTTPKSVQVEYAQSVKNPVSLHGDTLVNYVRPHQKNPQAELVEVPPHNKYSSLHDDLRVNFRGPLPPLNPDAEVLTGPIGKESGSFISYQLPGDDGAHFYFLTPQLAQKRDQGAGYYFERGEASDQADRQRKR